MNDVITIAKFTIKDMLKRKSFIISTIILLLMIVIGFNIPNIINSFSDTEGKEKILISDIDNIFEDKLDLLSSDVTEIIVFNDSVENIKNKMIDENIGKAIFIEKDENNIKMTYIVENAMYDYYNDIEESLSILYKNIQIEKLNLTDEQIMSINPNFIYETIQIEEEANGNVFVMMLMSIILFYAVYFGAFQVSSSITTEKTSKIIETLVTSTSPTNIVLGKTIGIGLVGLFQLILIIITAFISATSFLDTEMISSVLDISTLTIPLGLITLLYFILGYFTYAFLYALTGSTISKPEDIQAANTPVAIISLIGFYLSYFTMMNPTSNLNLIAGLVPISSAFCMPFRIMMGVATPSEVILSILILIITIFIIAKISIKIYSNAILNYGAKMSLKDIISIYKQK